MEDIYVVGISKDYTPPSPSFNMDTFNFSLSLDKAIDSITKVSCCANGFVEEIFKSLGSNYATVYLSIELRVDYMCSETTMNFHKFTLDKMIYVNLGESICKRNFTVDTEILDLGVISVKDNIIDIYSVILSCLY